MSRWVIAWGVLIMALSNPVLPTLTAATSDPIQNTTDTGTGIAITRHGHKPGDTPPVKAALTEWQRNIVTLLGGGEFNHGGPIQGLVVKVDTLKVGVYPIRYRYGGTATLFEGDAEKSLAASNTHYLYLDADGTLKTSTSAYPANAWRLATVTCGASDITDIQDDRMENIDSNPSTEWYNTAAAAAVDLDGNNLVDVGKLDFDASDYASPTEISGDELTVTESYMNIDGEGAANDDLDTLSADATFKLLILRNGGLNVITVKHNSGNIHLLGDTDFELKDGKIMVFVQVGVTGWHEVARTEANMPTTISDAISIQAPLWTIGAISAGYSSIVLSGGVATIDDDDSMYLRLLGEGGAADDLDTITNSDTNYYRILMIRAHEQDITVKHNTGNIHLYNGEDLTLAASSMEFVILTDEGSGSDYYEIARSHHTADDLAASANKTYSVSDEITAHIAGALASGTQVWAWIPRYDGKIVDIAGYVDTAPSGGSCIVNVLINTAAIFANEANAIVITDGNNSDVSAVTSPTVTFAANDVVQISISASDSSPNGAEDLTVTLNVMKCLQAEP